MFLQVSCLLRFPLDLIVLAKIITINEKTKKDFVFHSIYTTLLKLSGGKLHLRIG